MVLNSHYREHKVPRGGKHARRSRQAWRNGRPNKRRHLEGWERAAEEEEDGVREMKRVWGQDEVSGFIPDVQSLACCQVKWSGEHFSCHSAGVKSTQNAFTTLAFIVAAMLISGSVPRLRDHQWHSGEGRQLKLKCWWRSAVCNFGGAFHAWENNQETGLVFHEVYLPEKRHQVNLLHPFHSAHCSMWEFPLVDDKVVFSSPRFKQYFTNVNSAMFAKQPCLNLWAHVKIRIMKASP